MPPAIIGGAIAAVGTVAGAAIGSKGAKKAAQVSERQAAADRALQTQVRAENTAALSPFMQRGNVAGDTINSLLGLGVTGTAGAASPTAGQSATDAYNLFKQSTGYQTRLGEGMRAINSGYAANGTLQSGAALKSALRYGQDYASNEFGNYLGYLGNQQGVGLSGASALAGVGQNYANSMTAIGQNNAALQSQAAIANARNSQGALAGLAGIAGNTVGALSSYNPSVYQRLAPDVANNIAANPAIF